MVLTRAATKHTESANDTFCIAQTSTKECKPEEFSANPKRRRRGKSRKLCQLNLDVLHLVRHFLVLFLFSDQDGSTRNKIAQYIRPLDLLNLARTCKSLRALLMDKSSLFVWKTARGGVEGLPDCPVDLTEPEYANLMFHARCHGCGKYAKKILWHIRRRYCPECRETRLREYSSCNQIVLQYYHVLPVEALTTNGENTQWVDREQLDSFLQRYHRSSDKETFMAQMRAKVHIIYSHARDCKEWEHRMSMDHGCDLYNRRKEREKCIFERLKQHGYGPEIACHGELRIKLCHMPFFKTVKPLTEREWAQMLPEWAESMKPLRDKRIDQEVYQPRRNLLASEYDDYVTHSSPPVALLPHLMDLMRFSPFRDIIYAPEGTHLCPKPFESAFEQLPGLVEEWKKRFDTELAELVKIPSRSQGNAPSPERTPVSIDKLRLACAAFDLECVVTHYPDLLSRLCPRGTVCETETLDNNVPIGDRFKVSFFEGATYIVEACGLDPRVATIEDMDYRNARMKCLSCNDRYIRTWRNAMQHAQGFCGSTHWELVEDKYIDRIQNIERRDNSLTSGYARCLLCRPCVGDLMLESRVLCHLVHCHSIERDAIQQDVHFSVVYMHPSYCLVRMTEDGSLEEYY